MNIQKITCKENARDNLNIYLKKITAVLHMFLRKKKKNRTSFQLFFMAQVYLAAKTENNHMKMQHYIVISFVYMKRTS